MTVPDDCFTTIIRYPRWEALLTQMEFCQQYSRLADEPFCLALEGVTGIGKSTLVRRYAARAPRVETASGSRIPILYVATPCPVTVKEMAIAILQALGDPAAAFHSTWAINTRLIHHLRACAVELVILDDFHHLIDTDRDRVLKTVSEWLKVLLKETGIPFVVIGMPGSTERIFAANAQLSRLFHIREPLLPLTLGECERFIALALQAFSMSLSPEIDTKDAVRRSVYASDGVIGHLMGLYRLATFTARQQEETVLSWEMLAQAYRRSLARHFPGKRNPFLPEYRAELWKAGPA